MKNTWVFPATTGIYNSPMWLTSNATGADFFSNQIDFEFFDDAQGQILSISPSGIFVINGRSVPNGIFQIIPNNTINVLYPESLIWDGITNQLQVMISEDLVNTNFIQITFYRGL